MYLKIKLTELNRSTGLFLMHLEIYKTDKNTNASQIACHLCPLTLRLFYDSNCVSCFLNTHANVVYFLLQSAFKHVKAMVLIN